MALTPTLNVLAPGLTRRLTGARWLAPAQAGLVPVAIGLVLAGGAVAGLLATG